MRVFVTGATGFVGFAVVQELLRAGHEVTGLARSDAAATALTTAGANVHRGELTNLESLKTAADQSDGVIHAGFVHDFSRFKEVCEIDRQAIEAIGSVLRGSSRPFIITSGVGLLSSQNGKPILEKDVPAPEAPHPRVATEIAARLVAERGVNVSILRLPPSVHGIGDHGFVPLLIDLSRRKGVAAFIGEGQNDWSAVHRMDAAVVYRLALEKNERFATYHAVAEEGLPFKKIAQAIGEGLRLPVQSKSGKEAEAHFEWFQHFASMSLLTSAQETRSKLNWKPIQIGLLQDMKHASYFARPT